MTWDVVIIGGGATGLGIALDASLRGYKTILLEQSDFTKGTSSRSTKLVHGGVRYLAQGDIKLVFEALRERGLILKNAPHVTHNQTFIVPSYSWAKGFWYFLGLKVYDLLAGSLSLGRSTMISKQTTLQHLPTLDPKGLKMGIMYHDGQFDDSRLGINLAQSCSDLGACTINYMKVTAFEKNDKGEIEKLLAEDLETKSKHIIRGKVFINATGVYVDEIMHMDNPQMPPMVRPSQGAHIVLDRSFLPGNHALMIPKTDDGRVLFAVPWNGKTLVGTTDTLMDENPIEPVPLKQEVDFILSNFAKYTSLKPSTTDVLAVFAGLRPLARPQKAGKSTKEISRNHKILASESGLITITGGKWTTYRKMAEDTINTAIRLGRIPKRECTTKNHKIHAYKINMDKANWLHIYGNDAKHILNLMDETPPLKQKLHDKYPYTHAQVVWAVRQEMARTVEDFLSRRIRILVLDAKAALEMAPIVAQIMAREMDKDGQWQQEQIRAFSQTVQGYLLVS